MLAASGAGKTMTLRLIAGVAKPEVGRVANGRVLFDSAAHVNIPPSKDTSALFSDYAPFPHMTVAENIAFGLHGLPEADRTIRVREQIQRMRISDLAGRYPKEISGGQRQRVAIARLSRLSPMPCCSTNRSQRLIRSAPADGRAAA